jgi:hypothetical protein
VVETTTRLLRQPVTNESLLICLICIADLVTTLYWVNTGMAQEGNPIMAFFLDQSNAMFIGAKIGTFVPAVVAAEYYRNVRPGWVVRAMRWTIAAYLFIYVASVFAHLGDAGEFYRNLLGI